MTKAIPSFKYIEYCPVNHLKTWMIENKDDLVFPISDKNVTCNKETCFKRRFR